MFGRDIIEVATFRGHHQEQKNKSISQQSKEGMLLRDNVYGTIDEDAERRDFTINAMAVRLNSANYGELVDKFGGDSVEEMRARWKLYHDMARER